jgi:dipeptidase D
MTPLELILARFEQLSAVPRGTKNEAGLRQWLAEWAGARGLESRVDAIGNLIVYVPASAGCEDQPTLILQGHLDMVCQKTPDSPHDFTRDPIRILRDGDWLKADRTTLGADNGIAIALMMALAEDAGVAHPPLELLLTIEEEVSGAGADYIDPANLTGRTLLNLDSESEGVFVVGAAGSGSLFLHLPVTWSPPAAGEAAFLLRVDGLQGGHSGVAIHKHRGNANKLLARVLDDLQREFPIRLVRIQGGNARNAIPRKAEAVFLCSAEASPRCHELAADFERILRAEYSATESGLTLTLEAVNAPARAMSQAESQTAILFLHSLPNGVAGMSATLAGFVETSNNIGVVETRADELYLISSQRSGVFTRMEEITGRIESLARLAGLRVEREKLFPPWQANLESPLLKKARTAYEGCFGVQPQVEVIHAGLECGIISDRCGGLDTLSCGPTIRNPHSPDEQLHVPSVQKVWDFLVALLALR